MVANTPALGRVPEFPRFFGLGPLQSGVLQQLIQIESIFPGVQNVWYPAEVMRQAAADAQVLRYRIPVTQNKSLFSLIGTKHAFCSMLAL